MGAFIDTNTVGLDIERQVRQAQERGKPPSFAATLPPPYLNRMGYISLYEAHEDYRSYARKMNNRAIQMNVTQTMRPHILHGPAPPILSLRGTTLQEVATKVNHIHDECIMFVKTIYNAHRVVGTCMLVEDDNGDCLMLSLYNFVTVNEDPKDIFPKGTYLALLAPYMKNSADDPSRNLLLRCDNPECVRMFSSRRSWLAAKRGKKLVDTEGLDPSQLRKDGNAAFTDGRYEPAARLYSSALECQSIGDDDKLTCFSNLAEVRLRQEQWESAEENAMTALELDDTNVKAKFRLASAQIRLNKIDEASKLIANENGKVFQRLRDDIGRLLEEQDGLYGFAKMRKEEAGRPGEALSTFHSNYTSPDIQRSVQITKRDDFSYRGTVATGTIERNTLISSSKAVVFCRRREQFSRQHNFDPYSKCSLSGSTMELENELIVLMHRRPELRGRLYSLASGIGDAANKSNAKIDTKRIQGIVTSNTFGVSEEGLVSAWKQCKHFQGGKSNSDLIEKHQCGSGLWLNESLFNHSCIPNCTWRPIGDQMFVWTTRDIEAGEELCISYVSHDQSFSKREAGFQNWIKPNIGFCCQCDWCHEIRSSAELRELEERVHGAYRMAADLVSFQSIKMALAAERAMSVEERQVCFKIFSKLPPALQHNAGAELWVMEGVCLAHNGEFESALKAYEKAAEIKYAVRGGFSIERAKDLWRIVGASLACGYQTKALAVLCSIYQDIFAKSDMANVKDAFRGLTLKYSLSWWQDSYDMQRQNTIEALIARAIDDNKLKTKGKSGKKRR
jgi:tetratricopeptide (TPR) repeat protein